MKKEFVKYMYGTMTWPEIKEASAAKRIAIVPIATVEDHAYHLPVDTDIMIASEVCRMAGELVPDKIVILPTVNYGINMHHFDFPGAIDIPPQAFIDTLTGITKSLITHGFKRIILINAHGSNKDYVNIAAKRTTWENEDVICVATTPMMMMGKKEINEIRVSEPGGISHAGELETAMYLYYDESLVDMSKATKEWGQHKSQFYGWDGTAASNKVIFNDIWSKTSKSGVNGDATCATKENGKAFFDSAVNNLVAFIEEFQNWDIRKRVSHQD